MCAFELLIGRTVPLSFVEKVFNIQAGPSSQTA